MRGGRSWSRPVGVQPLGCSGAGLSRCVFPRENPGFVPSGTPDNSPPFQRWVSIPDEPTSPDRDGRRLRKPRRWPRRRGATDAGFCRPCRGCDFGRLANPPMNRWAIFGCPWRDKDEPQLRRVPIPCGFSLRFPPWKTWPVPEQAQAWTPTLTRPAHWQPTRAGAARGRCCPVPDRGCWRRSSRRGTRRSCGSARGPGRFPDPHPWS